MNILVTGGAGYIGSHFMEAFLSSGHAHDSKIWLVDDLSAGHAEFADTLRVLAKGKGVSEFHVEKKSLIDEGFVKRIVQESEPDIVFHFAGKISVEESVKDPDLYFKYNVKSARNLLQALQNSECRRFIFSSTAAVYEPSTQLEPSPMSEDAPIGPSNPYGENKLQVEKMLEHAAKTWGLNAVIFRYFNAAGASLSGRFGEWHEPETHLIPLLLRQEEKPDEPFKVYGSNYPTRDGTCVRDYIHVADLAAAHLQAIPFILEKGSKPAGICEVFNLGTHQGVTVLEMIEAAAKVVGKKIPFKLTERRVGDCPFLVASSAKAQELLRWKPEHSSVEQILMTAYRWEKILRSFRPAQS